MKSVILGTYYDMISVRKIFWIYSLSYSIWRSSIT